MYSDYLITSMLIGLFSSVLLVARSLQAFTQTGPQVKDEILENYRFYSVYALFRLGVWSFMAITWMSLLGGVSYLAVSVSGYIEPSNLGFAISGAAGIIVITLLQFSRHLLYIPSSIMMSSNYMMSHFYPLWSTLTVTRLRWALIVLIIIIGCPLLSSLSALAATAQWKHFSILMLIALLLITPCMFAAWPGVTRARKKSESRKGRPNIVMIGCDTLRVDRLGACKYGRSLTPFIDALTKKGVTFTNCYTPLARTAPSLASLLTGTWPFRNGIRTNFVSDRKSLLPFEALPKILGNNGYETVAISDWAGSDLGKLSMGFEHTDVPEDQWNLKYLIRQGPKDIRLFLSLFFNNRIGWALLPEIYYMAGTPLTADLGKKAKKWIDRLAGNDRPFFLNVFMATSHPPFGSEYPYYRHYSPADYSGESKFAMARLEDPFDIIRSMREPREAFELDQIIDLYDGCVRRFDDEVRGIVQQLKKSGVDNNTIVLIYSDHGMELFEHDTWGQGNSAVGEASPRVPLVVVDPRSSGHGVDSRVVRTVDVAPTLLEMCGIDAPVYMDGVSLTGYLADMNIDWKLPAYFETGVWLAPPPGRHAEHITYPDVMDLLHVPDYSTGTLALKEEYAEVIEKARDRMVRQGRWKLVQFPLKNRMLFQLFDLESDPGCNNDVSAQHPQVVDELTSLLQGWGAHIAAS